MSQFSAYKNSINMSSARIIPEDLAQLLTFDEPITMQQYQPQTQSGLLQEVSEPFELSVAAPNQHDKSYFPQRVQTSLQHENKNTFAIGSPYPERQYLSENYQQYQPQPQSALLQEVSEPFEQYLAAPNQQDTSYFQQRIPTSLQHENKNFFAIGSSYPEHQYFLRNYQQYQPQPQSALLQEVSEPFKKSVAAPIEHDIPYFQERVPRSSQHENGNIFAIGSSYPEHQYFSGNYQNTYINGNMASSGSQIICQKPHSDGNQLTPNNNLVKAPINDNQLDLDSNTFKLEKKVIKQFKAGTKKVIKSGKRFRTKFTTNQEQALEAVFKRQKYISIAERKKLSENLDLKEEPIKLWFQNRRSKSRRDQQVPDLHKEDWPQEPYSNQSLASTSSNLVFIEALLQSPNEDGFVPLENEDMEQLLNVLDSVIPVSTVIDTFVQ